MAKEDKKAPAKTKTYTLIGRQHTGFDENGERKEFATGDKVKLTDVQYEAFKDKFEAPKGLNDEDEAEFTATQPQEDVGEKKDKAPEAPKTTPTSGDKGAGAAANSTNSAKV